MLNSLKGVKHKNKSNKSQIWSLIFKFKEKEFEFKGILEIIQNGWLAMFDSLYFEIVSNKWTPDHMKSVVQSMYFIMESNLE